MNLGTGIIGGKVPSVEEYTLQSNGASQASYTFTGPTLSKAGLFIIRTLVGGTFNATRTASGVTVNGVGATLIQQNNAFVSLGGSTAMGIFSIYLAAGATGSIVVSVSGGNAACCAIHPLTILDLKSTTEHHKNGNSANTGTSVSTTLNIPSGGVQIIAAGSLDGSSSHTPTGFTDSPSSGTQVDTSWRFHGGFDIRMGAETGRTLTSTAVSSTGRRAIAAVSFR
jgi:hypothetical protein